MLEGYEALVIVAVLAIIFIRGPGKLPEMARSIGKAKSEYDKAIKQATSLTDPSSITNPQTDPQTPPLTTPENPPTQSPTTQTPQDPILVAAKSIGMKTEGKTQEELAREILGKTAKTSVQSSEKSPS
jgi:sec-independent protein translocase protein TatA